MDANCEVPLPVNLNCWKHHAGFINHQVKLFLNDKQINELRQHLLKIGDSRMDLYLGKYSPAEISGQIINSLNRKRVFQPEKFKEWLQKDGSDYQLIALKDKSLWTLRFGENPERYVHIHPGRYSPHTIRVKATTLKTAIFILYLLQTGDIQAINTETVNQVRKKYLAEPPLKSLSKAAGLIKLLNLFQKL